MHACARVNLTREEAFSAVLKWSTTQCLWDIQSTLSPLTQQQNSCTVYGGEGREGMQSFSF